MSKHDDETFVLRSDKEVDMTGLQRPRCDRTWKALTKWLQSKGEADAKPVHALRKSIGSLMANKFGIHAAQRLLRHTSPTITSKFYTDRTASVLPGIGSLLGSGCRRRLEHRPLFDQSTHRPFPLRCDSAH